MDLIPLIKEKVLSVCKKKGWVGVRKLRIAFRNLKSRKSDIINRAEFKYFLNDFGISLLDSEISFIFLQFDQNRRDQINFMQVFDSFVEVSDQRLEWIKQFSQQLSKGTGKISFNYLEGLVNTDFHPEVERK